MSGNPMHRKQDGVLALDPNGSSALSAWVDGEGSDHDWDAVWAAQPPDEASADWHRYHLIGELLRKGGNAEGVQRADDALAFARRVTALAQSQGPEGVAAAPVASSIGTAAQAPASWQERREADPSRTAANDGTYRWKMVAGFASFTAVLGIVWGVSGGQGALTGPELARLATPPEAVSVASAPVRVSTPQGEVVRDARLQELVLTHRRAGGINALQAPAGFLRTSALDAHGR